MTHITKSGTELISPLRLQSAKLYLLTAIQYSALSKLTEKRQYKLYDFYIKTKESQVELIA